MPASHPTEIDERLMAAALRLGRRHLGQTSPNPAVGALIVRPTADGPRIVGRGWTGAGGRPHAEEAALAMAGAAARGATAYVTLEPCSHEGRGPPCAQSLVAAGIGRAVTAMEDPDPRVAGSGHRILRDAGVAVETGILEADARVMHSGHILRVTQNRPHVTLKLAVSADGMIGRNSGERMIITEKPAFDRVQGMRSESDAVMVGIGTALIDDPRLTIRHPGMQARAPVRIILDSQARLPLTSNLVAGAREVPLWVVVSEETPREKWQALDEAGVSIIPVPPAKAGVDLGKALAAFAERGVMRILAEGGSHVAASLLTRGFIDEVVLIRASVVVGPDGVRAFAGQALSAIERSPRYRLVEDHPVGADHLRRYLRAG